MSDLEELARRFFGAFGRDDSTEVMRGAMTEDAVSWITNAEGGSDRVEGREAGSLHDGYRSSPEG